MRDRKLKGVAGGIAAAADIEPNLVRLLFAVAALSGWGIVAYVLLAIVLRDETPAEPARPLALEQRRILRIGLTVAAVVAAGRLFDGWFLGGGGGFGLPLILVAVGAAVLWVRRDSGAEAGAGDRPDLPWPPPPPRPGDPVAGGPAAAPPIPGAPPAAPWPTGPPPARGVNWRSTGGDLLRLVAAFAAVGFLLALLAGTLLVLVGALPMRLPALPAIVGAVALVALVASVVQRGRTGRLLAAGAGLVVAAVLALGLTSFPQGAGERIVTVGTTNPLLARYDHDAGHLVLDLAQLPLAPEETRRVAARVGAGQLMVILPRAASVTEVRARAGAGTTTLFGRRRSGPGLDVTDSAPGPAGGGRLELDLEVGVGRIKTIAPEEATLRVSCSLTEDVVGPSRVITCPHPPALASTAMTCSVVLVDPDGGAAGRGFCRRLGAAEPPAAGTFAVSCTVPSDDDTASCAELTPRQLARLPLPAGPLPGPLDPGSPDAGTLRCGPAEPDGTRTCTAATTAAPTTSPPVTSPPVTSAPFTSTPFTSTPLTSAPGSSAPGSSATTTAEAEAPATYRCTEAPATGRLTCAPAG